MFSGGRGISGHVRIIATTFIGLRINQSAVLRRRSREENRQAGYVGTMQFQTDREHVMFRKRLHRVSRIPIIQLVRVNVIGEDVAELSDGITLVV